MEKKKIIFERELHARSEKTIWPLISTPEGLAKWIADEVTRDGESLQFTWGVDWRHHEERTAVVTQEVPPIHFGWMWEDEDFSVEMEIKRSDITGDYILIVTDYAEKDDEDWLRAVWESNFERLHSTTGL